MKNIKINIPPALLEFTQQTCSVELVAVNVGEALLLLCQNYPLLTSHLIDEQGEIIKALNISIDQVAIEKMQGLNTLLKGGNLINIEITAKD